MTDAERYLILIEGGPPSNYSAWSPDLLGCVATGDTIDQTVAEMREAIAFHLEGLPPTTTRSPSPPDPASTSSSTPPQPPDPASDHAVPAKRCPRLPLSHVMHPRRDSMARLRQN